MLALMHSTLIDGTGSKPVNNATVIIDGKKITSVGHGIAVPEEAQVIDLKGQFLMPGLIDAHVHFGGSNNLNRAGCAGRFATYDYSENRESALKWGITAVRSAGDFTPDIIEFRDEVNSGKHRSPRILACGKMIQAKGGHPLSSVYFDNSEIEQNACVLVDENTDIESEVHKLADLGVDWIKTFASDDNRFNYPNGVPRISNDQLRRIVDAAHKCGKPVMMHVDDIDDIKDAVNTGADTIEHTINVASVNHRMTDEVLKLLTDGDVWVVPTLVATMLFEGKIDNLPPVWPELQTVVKRMVQAGVKLGVGCDSGIPFVPFGECVHMEMELLVEAGLSPLGVLTAATGGNSKMLRVSDTFGTCAPGMVADLIVLGGNPVENIRNTRDVRLVIRDGRIVVDHLLGC